MINKNITRRGFAGALGLGAMAALAGCGGSGGETAVDEELKATMVTDTGGIHDQSFNQLAWAGLEQLEAEGDWKVGYLESHQESDYVTNLDKAVDDGCRIIWGIGFAMGEAINNVAEQNPDCQFAIIDSTNDRDLPNLIGVVFRAQEPSFVVGYIAANMSSSGKVGFVGGMKSELIDQFEYGYYAGIEYANKKKGLKVTYQGQYAESFTDSAKGKSIAQKMIQDGCDVLFHAAGGTGVGMLDACKEAGVKSIGVDQDQSLVRTDDKSIITSALKRVDTAVVNVSHGVVDGTIDSGSNVAMGATEGAVGIPDNIIHDGETEPRLPDALYDEALDLFEQIKDGTIVVPDNQEKFNEFVKTI